MPSLGSMVELTLVVWMLESRPTGHESRWSGPALHWASQGELALVAWVRKSWTQRPEHQRVSWCLSSHHSRKAALPPPGQRGGEPTLVVEVQERGLAELLSYHPGPDAGLWVYPPQYLPHPWIAAVPSILQNQSFRTFMTPSYNRISERNSKENPVLIV